MMAKIKKTWLFRFIAHVLDNNSLGLAAQTAFFLLIAFVPLALFATSFLSPDTKWATGIIPEDFMLLLADSEIPKFSNPVLFVVSAWSASAAAWALMRGISAAYTGRPLMSIKARASAILITLGFIAVIAITLTLVAIDQWLALIAAAIAIYSLLFLLYTKTPGTTASVRQCSWTALIATIGWLLVTKGFEIYLNFFSNFSVLYGSFGAFMGVTFWAFGISIVVILGAEVSAFLSIIEDKKDETI